MTHLKHLILRTALAVCVIAATATAEKVHLIVHIPADTRASDSIYLAGSLTSVGGWKADGVKLARQHDGTLTGDLDVEIGQTLEFKITRGSWDTVEKFADGGERPNRSIRIDASTKQIEATVERWASGDGGARRASTVVGTLKLHPIDSAALKQPRTIRVWLPPGYDDASDARYPVLYMHDGQNCFDRATSAFGNEWEIDETLTKLISEKTIPPLIVIGIDNGGANRINEFTYEVDPRHGGGHADTYVRFVLREVMPFVGKTYRVRTGTSSTFIGGSSLGGLISLEIARRNPHVFGGVIAMSPSLQWSNEALTTAIEKDPGGLSDPRIWLDMGTREGLATAATQPAINQHDPMIDAVNRLGAALAHHGIKHHLEIAEGAEHNERAWAARFPKAVKYLLGGD
ncbi:MAG TPA: alpha/beta hydrolase-fold protein [Tepidisphaeraceae bacterium]|jgi:predicted alpha/beta superfamily hydrolase